MYLVREYLKLTMQIMKHIIALFFENVKKMGVFPLGEKTKGKLHHHLTNTAKIPYQTVTPITGFYEATALFKII